MSERRLTITAGVDQAIRRHGQEAYPHECCGALVGRAGHVTEIVALPNTTFRDGIPDGFAVSPDLPGHLYLAYDAWDGAQYDVFLVQSTDYGQTWSQPVKVNDNTDVSE